MHPYRPNNIWPNFRGAGLRHNNLTLITNWDLCFLINWISHYIVIGYKLVFSKVLILLVWLSIIDINHIWLITSLKLLSFRVVRLVSLTSPTSIIVLIALFLTRNSIILQLLPIGLSISVYFWVELLLRYNFILVFGHISSVHLLNLVSLIRNICFHYLRPKFSCLF